jgi:hypothetical protein
MSEHVGASTSRNPKGLHGLYRDSFTFTISNGDVAKICSAEADQKMVVSKDVDGDSHGLSATAALFRI